MKILRMAITLILLIASWSYAQNIPMTMFEKIKTEQVPTAVLKTFESDLDKSKRDQKWSLVLPLPAYYR